MAVTPYVNEISGNSISDDAARDKIDNPTNGLRQDVYNLAKVVNAIILAIQLSEETAHENYLTIQQAFLTIANQSSKSGTPSKDDTVVSAVTGVNSIPTHTDREYFPAIREKKSNIF